MTADLLQKPQILKIVGSTIFIAHPDLTGYTRTEVTSPLTAAGTTLTEADNNGFADNDWFILGEVGDNKTEECDVNGAVTRGTSMTITNTTKFDHEIHSPVTKVLERGIKIYGAATDGGTGTLIASVDAITSPIADAVSIQWNRQNTEYTMISTDTAYAYYFVKFTDGVTDSEASDYVLAAGLTYDTAEEIIMGGLRRVNAKIDPETDGLINREWLLDVFNDFQDEVTTFEMTTPSGNKIAKDWSFEVFENNTSLTLTQNENKYALSGLTETLKYGDSKTGLINAKLGTDILRYIDINTYESRMTDKIRTEVATEASAGDTSIVLDDTYEFSESGTVYIGADTVTYTTNTESTSTLSGIPASGTGSITATRAVDTVVWQGVTPATPTLFTIFNGDILLPTPPKESLVGYKIKIKGYKKLDRLTDFSQTTEIPFTHLGKLYIGAQVQFRKGNTAEAERLMAEFNQKLNNQALKDKTQVKQGFAYYNFADIDNRETKVFTN